MAAGKIVDEPGGGVNSQRGAADNQQVGAANIVDRAFNHAVVQPFLIQNHIGFDNAAAGTGGDAGTVADKFHRIGGFAPHAVVAVNGAVELPDPLRTGQLMEAIDVLSHHGPQFSCRLQFRQLPMGGVGFCIKTQHLVPIKPIKFLGVPVEKAAAQNGFRRPAVLLIVQAIHTAKIWYSRLCGYSGAAEKNGAAALINPALQGL